MIVIRLDHLNSLVNGMSFSHGLKPAQWAALRYLARSSESDRRMSRFAIFHATSKSAASQTLAVLIRKGYVTAQLHPDDPRIKVLDLTSQGRKIIKHDPLLGMRAMLHTIDEKELGRFNDVLEALVDWASESQRDVR